MNSQMGLQIFILLRLLLECACIGERSPLLEDEVHPVKTLRKFPSTEAPFTFHKMDKVMGSNFTNNCPEPQNDAHCAKNRSLGDQERTRSQALPVLVVVSFCFYPDPTVTQPANANKRFHLSLQTENGNGAIGI